MNSDRRTFIKNSAMAGAALGLNSIPLNRFSKQAADVIRIGIIGLDTSHAPAFAELFNAENPEPGLSGFRVVAAYPKGSTEIKSSLETIPEYTEKVRQMGIEVADSIKSLVKKADAFLILTNDGQVHLEQARELFGAGKPIFVDKPVTASLSDAVITLQGSKGKEDSPVFGFSPSLSEKCTGSTIRK